MKIFGNFSKAIGPDKFWKIFQNLSKGYFRTYGNLTNARSHFNSEGALMSNMFCLPPQEPVIVEPDYHIILPNDSSSLIPSLPDTTPPRPLPANFVLQPLATIKCDAGTFERLRRISKEVKAVTRVRWDDELLFEDIQKIIDEITNQQIKDKIANQRDQIIEKKNTGPQKNYLYLFQLTESLTEQDIEDIEAHCEFVEVTMDPELTEEEATSLNDSSEQGWWPLS